MPAMLAARLYRVLPLLAILAIIGIVVYIFMSWRYTPARAKEAVIKNLHRPKRRPVDSLCARNALRMD